ncbi:AAA domain-containing protein [Ferrovum myxofaciens]|uniref:AAA family ATPase n=1 Tax=Ferrovum myxofaciens TaxID=416213 RepID=A0A9E6MYV4_9PROT|nr:AAA domain-containing protein [Ferrovum myxofaciens]QKE37582.1 MAG: AAA family ATPase [Ferrovum myxofaciens]QWY75238.1 MAG: AAA family ATPase [Ferrovum myxofaciens]QWY77973.1 MAG: AAA family ATPase [Ferrovum myxofaciens]
MSNVIKSKVRQLYYFLKEANQLRFRPVRNLGEQPKVVRLADMPSHPSMQIFRPVRVENAQEIPDTLLRIRRPAITRCPAPPESITSWLLPNWDDPSKSVAYAESLNVTNDDDGKTTTILFDDDEQRVSDSADWIELRNVWVVPELAARKAMRFFEVFYDIYSTIEKDSEQLELLVADGHFSWQTTSGVDGKIVIEHPVLLKRVELRFDPNVPEFTIHETDREAELYGSLFADLQDIAPAALRNRKNELEISGYHPLGWEDTEAFLKAFIQTVSPLSGEFLDKLSTETASTTPRLWRDPVLLLRKRIAGIANAVDAIIDDIDHQNVFPSSLAQITGTMDSWEGSGLCDGLGSSGSDSGQVAGITPVVFSDDDILLAKEANDAQLQIIRRLNHSGSVIVQGPPGTGKTHTIGNLIGHLLAQGNSILVTAQTAKALRVLRDKVPEVLQPLCVSVLGSDNDARQQLESSIGSITERLTSDTSDTLLHKATQFEDERKKLLCQSKELNHKLREALENEYREIVVGDRHFSPSDAARFVANHRDAHGWIPAQVKLGGNPSLTEQELVRLYALGTSYSAEEEQDARHPLPEMAELPSERQFQVMVSEYQHLLTCDLTVGSDKWQSGGNGSDAIEALANTLEAEFSDDMRRQSWRPYAIVAGIHGGTEMEVWERLITNIEKASEANSKHALVLHHRPRLSETLPIHKQRQITVEICKHIDTGGKLGFLQLATRSEWRQFINTVSVTAGQPNHRTHFEAIGHLAELESMRLELEDLWNTLIGQHISSLFKTMGTAPELACRALIPEIRRCLAWHSTVWEPLGTMLKAEGLKLDNLLASLPREASQVSEYLLIERLASSVVPPLLAAEAGRRKLKEYEAGFDRLANLSTQVDPTSPDNGCIGRIIAAVRSRNAEGYSAALEYARRLHTVKPLVVERDALTKKLLLVAPGWAEHIIHRVPPHHQGQVPGDFSMAWAWRQLHDTLAERDKLEAQELQLEIEKTRDTLRQITQWLIDAKAWGKQLERLQGNHTIRQALVGWLDTTKRLLSTKQVDRRQTLQSEARKLMKKCADAVPVWIMPISIMAESFDPRTTRFDVVIIDEASQADLNALIPLYMGKQVVIVGDHEQVTPLGVGKGQAILENLRKSMLQDIPNSHLFDNMSSIYDIGRQSFGDAVRLVEHFRCVPEIIAFSNQLSYEGKILPLRESNSTNIKPACVACHVDGIREGDTNKAEAERIIATIKAMIRHPMYAGKSIGVISMLGDNQAVLIQSMLHKEVEGIEIEKRRIQAGISGEFQGDERDIIFLSMVDSSSDEGTLRAVGEGAFELIKKRYNVAVSRARDQLWVVHSFDPALHLKVTDLRFKLLQHVKDPLASLRAFNQEVGKTESPFEREVLKRLTDAGFKVKTQWQVGYFRIDMVVEGGGKRLAVECDGDRYHPMEKLAEDMNRQAILERLGWQFARIRGSAFYRDRELSMRPVFARLAELEIPPEANMDEQPVSDMTLIHELDDMIVQGFNIEEVQEHEVLISDELDSITGGDDHSEFGGFTTNPADLDYGQVESLLGSLGGIAPLDDFLRQFAKAKGFQRLGRSVRKGLESELSRLSRTGKIVIESGVIRLI